MDQLRTGYDHIAVGGPETFFNFIMQGSKTTLRTTCCHRNTYDASPQVGIEQRCVPSFLNRSVSMAVVS